jgi:hypothetical protein
MRSSCRRATRPDGRHLGRWSAASGRCRRCSSPRCHRCRWCRSRRRSSPHPVTNPGGRLSPTRRSAASARSRRFHREDVADRGWSGDHTIARVEGDPPQVLSLRRGPPARAVPTAPTTSSSPSLAYRSAFRSLRNRRSVGLASPSREVSPWKPPPPIELRSC